MKQYFAAFTALATLALAGAAHAEAGDFQIRLRAIGVLPTESAGGINPALPTASVGVDNAYTGEVDFTYFSPSISVPNSFWRRRTMMLPDAARAGSAKSLTPACCRRR
ncbi:hypothetical protein [Hankyongella ginsenosidimutans]|uniref:hypothetical protein n=1 Tax=Hankyongella ginsenosidimutans TaxID=1763828 RepID=UPI001FEAC5C1|nr:hypothetical protein [Hankyongella ginsenosidimutans]